MSGGDFGAFPCKQRPSILNVGSERGCLNRISIKKKKKGKSKERACTEEAEREMVGRTRLSQPTFCRYRKGRFTN